MSDCGVKCLVGLVAIFYKYSSKDQDKTHLSKSELKELLQNEFSPLFKEIKPDELDKTMKALDHDGDGQVDITEYMITLSALGICMSEEFMQRHCPKK